VTSFLTSSFGNLSSTFGDLSFDFFFFDLTQAKPPTTINPTKISGMNHDDGSTVDLRSSIVVDGITVVVLMGVVVGNGVVLTGVGVSVVITVVVVTGLTAEASNFGYCVFTTASEYFTTALEFITTASESLTVALDVFTPQFVLLTSAFESPQILQFDSFPSGGNLKTQTS
jgi:hypothetical protein